MFLAKKQDKKENEFLKKRYSNKDDRSGKQPQKPVGDDEEGYEDRQYQKEKGWNRNLEPEVLIPKGYNEKMEGDRMHDQGSILERMQHIMDQQVNLNKKY